MFGGGNTMQGRVGICHRELPALHFVFIAQVQENEAEQMLTVLVFSAWGGATGGGHCQQGSCREASQHH